MSDKNINTDQSTQLNPYSAPLCHHANDRNQENRSITNIFLILSIGFAISFVGIFVIDSSFGALAPAILSGLIFERAKPWSHLAIALTVAYTSFGVAYIGVDWLFSLHPDAIALSTDDEWIPVILRIYALAGITGAAIGIVVYSLCNRSLPKS